MSIGSSNMLIRLLQSAPSVYEKVKELRAGISRADKRLVTEFVGRLDERRVFYAPYHSERVEMVIGSLTRVVDDSLKTVASLNHGPSKAGVGLVLDATRRFLDRWGDARTPTARGRFPAWFEDETVKLFEDLGELRCQIRTAVEFLQEFSNPELRAPSILGEDE